MNLLKNLPVDRPLKLKDMIDIRPGRVVSMSLSRSDNCLMTLLAFSRGENVSDEQYLGDTFYYVLEGTMPITLGAECIHIHEGECYMVPAGTLHAVGGDEAFKLLQITVQG